MTRRRRSRIPLGLLLLAAAPLGAQPLRLARPLGDGAVLQRGVPIPVWGWAAPGAAVTATFRGTTRRAVADSAGRWTVVFPAASPGGPFTVSAASGARRVTSRDVLVGDVWVASGQSNMEMTVAASANARAEIAAAHDSGVRQLKVPISWSERPLDDVTGGSWAPADSRHVGEFSAVAYYLARELRRAHPNVPIGIVNTSWGGSAIETWLSADALRLGPDGAARALAAERARLDTVKQALLARVGPVAERDPGLANGRAVWADPALDDAAWRPIAVPSLWESQGYDAMDGVAWYRTTFTLSAEEAAAGATLRLGTIDDDDVTWVNGVEVGRTAGYNAERTYAVPARALRAGANVLAVRVADGGGGGGIYGTPDALRIELPGGQARPLAGTWKFRVGEIGATMDGQRLNKVPAITYNAMVRPLLPMAIRGVLWYQGESNANTVAQSVAYRDQFRTLITSWRDAWQGTRGADVPFLWVQLPNFMAPDSAPVPNPTWALHREAMDAALALPNTGRAVAIDVGEAEDIHPKDKQTVGTRLALVARDVAYAERVDASGPTYRSHEVRGDSIVVTFAHAEGGLVTRGDRVGAFQIAGADGKFVWATARADGQRVTVWSDAVRGPVAVRYAWANDPADANLYDRSGLPAAPFRTDHW